MHEETSATPKVTPQQLSARLKQEANHTQREAKREFFYMKLMTDWELGLEIIQQTLS